MAYLVEVAKSAEGQLDELYLWVVERAPSQGAAWFNGLEGAILSLEQLPKRCRLAPESFDPGHPVRVLNYGRRPHVYRVFFTVDESAKVGKGRVSLWTRRVTGRPSAAVARSGIVGV